MSLPPRQRRPPAKLRSNSPETVSSPKKKRQAPSKVTGATSPAPILSASLLSPSLKKKLETQGLIQPQQTVTTPGKSRVSPQRTPKAALITTSTSSSSSSSVPPGTAKVTPKRLLSKQGPTAFEDALNSANQAVPQASSKTALKFAPLFTTKGNTSSPSSTPSTPLATVTVTTALPRVVSASSLPRTASASALLDIDASSQGSSRVPSPSPSESAESKAPVYIFKDPNFVHSSKGTASGRKTRVWKNLKQIGAMERSLPWKPEDATYSGSDAPPSFHPAKKYSDITGLPAKYTDPQTKIRYATTEEFARIRILPSDIVAGYLTLRKANPAVP